MAAFRDAHKMGERSRTSQRISALTDAFGMVREATESLRPDRCPVESSALATGPTLIEWIEHLWNSSSLKSEGENL